MPHREVKPNLADRMCWLLLGQESSSPAPEGYANGKLEFYTN